jgi:transposase
MGKNMLKSENIAKAVIKHRKHYDDAFKRQVLDVCESGAYATVAECARSYDINENTLNNWRNRDQKTPEAIDNNNEIISLKKELAKAKMELEILKKAAIYFANHAK